MITTNYENIPLALRERPQWVAWRAEAYTTKDGKAKINKIPVDAKTGMSAKTDDFTTWSPYDQAVAHAQQYGLAGVGFVFCDSDEFTGIDFDNCVDDQGTINPKVEAILLRLNSYAEISPSRHGLKVFVKAKFPLTTGHKIQKDGYEIEAYNTRRYFTVTGHRLVAYPVDVTECSDAAKIYQEMFGKPPVVRSTASKPTGMATDGEALGIPDEAKRIREALKFIKADDYEKWLSIGFALRWWSTQGAGELAKQIWDEWSASSDKFNQGDSDYKWTTFDAQGQVEIDPATGSQTSRIITLGTLFKLARDSGWEDGNLPVVLLPPGGGGTLNSFGKILGGLLAATGRVYCRGGVAVELERDGHHGAPVLKPISSLRAVSLFEEVGRLKKMDKKGAKESTLCPTDLGARVLCARAFVDELPPIKSVVNCPALVVRPDGTLLEVAAYDAESGVLATGPATPSMPLEDAIGLLLTVAMDFDFATPGDHSRFLAALITPALIIGGGLDDRAPIEVTEADDSQAGKGYRNKLAAGIYKQLVTTVNMKSSGGVGSMEESFDQAIMRGKIFVAIDNVRGDLNSQKLETFMTEDSYTARVPYQPPIDVDPKRHVIMITSNKAEFTKDTVNRSSIVRIRKRPAGYAFAEYPEGDILDHVRANQPKFLGAVFTILREWFKQGHHRTKEHRHDFRGWAQSLDWIVQNILGVAPLLDGHQEVKKRILNPHLTWLRDVALAVFSAGLENTPLKTKEIISVLAAHNPECLMMITGEHADLVYEESMANALRAMGRKLSDCFGTDTCVGIDGYIACRDETTEAKKTGSGTYDVKRYRFTREPGGNPVLIDSKDAKPPSTSNEPPCEPQQPPLTAITAITPNKIGKDGEGNNVLSNNVQTNGGHGGYGGSLGFHGGFTSDINGTDPATPNPDQPEPAQPSISSPDAKPPEADPNEPMDGTLDGRESNFPTGHSGGQSGNTKINPKENHNEQ